jgi:hypothetical protein
MSTCERRHRLLGDSLPFTLLGIYPRWSFGVKVDFTVANQEPVSCPTK